MSLKTCIWIGFFIGSAVGGYVPELFGAGLFSFWGVIGNAVGGLLGIWAGYKLGTSYFA